MPTLDERIQKETEKLEQLKRQKRAMEQREKKKERAIDTRRKIINGGLLEAYFPEFAAFTPKYTKEENEAEFAPLAHFLSALAADKETVARLEAEASRRIAAESQQEA